MVSFLLNCHPSLPVQISKKPAYKSSVMPFDKFLLVFFSQKLSFLLNCRPSLPLQISRKLAYNSSVGINLASF